MSHVVKCKVDLKAGSALDDAIKQLGLEDLGQGTFELYGRNKATGRGVKLPDWNYPIVIADNGEVKYDNYGGSWGKQVELDKLVQRYSVEAAQEQALLSGYTVNETTLENGDIELECQQLATC